MYCKKNIKTSEAIVVHYLIKLLRNINIYNCYAEKSGSAKKPNTFTNERFFISRRYKKSLFLKEKTFYMLAFRF